MRGEVLGPMRRMGEGGAARERERGAELVSVCVCGAGTEEECHGYSVSEIRKDNSIIKLLVQLQRGFILPLTCCVSEE